MRYIASIVSMSLLALPAVADNLVVKGNVAANWSNAMRPSPSQDIIVHAGDSITITVTGSIDINQEVRHESSCFLFFCKDKTIPIHHYMTPAQFPVDFTIRPVGGGPALVTAMVGGVPSTIAVPVGDGNNFESAYEVVALVAGSGDQINPGKSGGTYDITMTVDAAPRAQYLQHWLDAVHPSATRAIAPAVIGEDMRTQGSVVAATLRNYAKSQFPVPNAANNNDHGMLVRKAVELAPADVDNSIALAAYFRAVGLDKEADGVLETIVSRLENSPDPHSQRQLGDAYIDRMQTALKKGGGVRAEASTDALSFVDKAIRAYSASHRSDLVSSAQYAKGLLLRGLRTRESLAAAEIAFKAALSDSTRIVSADAIFRSADSSRTFAMRLSDVWTASSVTEGWKPNDAMLPFGFPIGWDGFEHRLLVASSGQYSWVSDILGAPQSVSLPFPAFVRGIGGGAILYAKDPQTLDYYSKEQFVTSLPVGGAAVNTCAPPNFFSAGLSADGKVVGAQCGNALRVFAANGGGSIAQAWEFSRQVPGPPGIQAPPYLAVGPLSCGVVVASLPKPPNFQVVGLSLVRGGTELPLLDLSAMNPRAVAFYGDEIEILTAPDILSSFRCSDGVKSADIKLASVAMPSAPGPFAAQMSWISPNQLGIVRSWTHSIEVVTFPARSVARFESNPSIPRNGPFAALLLSATAANGPPRLMLQHADIKATELGGARSVNGFSAPMGFVSATADLSHFLVQGFGVSAWIADNNDHPLVSQAGADEVLVDRLSTGDGWISGKLDVTIPIFSPLSELWQMNGQTRGAQISLPPMPATFTPMVVDALRVINGIPTPVPVPDLDGFFPTSRIADVIGNPGLISARFNSMAGFYSPFSSAPLTSGTSRAAFVLCATPLARKSAGEAALPFNFPMPDQLFLATETNNTISIRALPDPLTTPPPGNAPRFPLCGGLNVVHGASPTASFRAPSGEFRLLVGNSWVTTDIHQALWQAWSTSAGDVFVLVPDAMPANVFSLLRVDRTGHSHPACARCTAIKLGDAMRLLVPDNGFTTSPQIARYADGMPGALFMMDANARVAAMPENDETVVTSIADGHELKRVPLGKPIALTEHQLYLAMGEGRVAIYEWQ